MRRSLSPLATAAICSVAAILLYIFSYFPASSVARDHPEYRPFLTQLYRPMPVWLTRQLGMLWWKFAAPHELLNEPVETGPY